MVWSGYVWSGYVWSGYVWSGYVWSGLTASALGSARIRIEGNVIRGAEGGARRRRPAGRPPAPLAGGAGRQKRAPWHLGWRGSGGGGDGAATSYKKRRRLV